MFGIPPGRIFLWLAMAATFYVGVQYAKVYFYVTEFNDFIADEVKFAPTRESTEEDHLQEHIRDASGQYGLEIDLGEIKVNKTHDMDNDISTLAVDVSYSVPVDLYFFKPAAHFQTHDSVSY
jgi:hypothetical protein